MLITHVNLSLLGFHPIAKTNKRAASSRVSQKKSPSVRGNNKNPPQLLVSTKFTQRYRFIANGAGGTVKTITFFDLIDLICVATGAAAAVRLCSGVKIKSIDVWAANSAGNASNTVQLEWLQSLFIGGPDEVINDTCLGLQDIAHIHCRPPRGSRVSEWLSNSALVGGADVDLFTLTIPQGGVVDLVLEQVLVESEASIGVTGAVVAATLGKFYTRSLDSATGTATIVPVGRDTI